MAAKKENKDRLHPRNRNRARYDLKALVASLPELKSHVKPNKYGDDSVDFADPIAVRLLNKALLKHYYGIKYWDFPSQNLCPPVPGRADYIHYIADLIAKHNDGKIIKGKQINCLDVGVGASCIYPILGVTEYGWHFTGSDINPKSIKSAQKIVSSNPSLKGKVKCVLQKNPASIFQGIMKDKVDVSICNPPFHSSKEEAMKGTKRKVRNLSGKNVKNPKPNFSGISDELIYEGGEYQFLQNMIKESKRFAKNCFWFTSLISKQSNLNGIHKFLEMNEAKEVKTIPMGTGNKSTRIVAWTFLTEEEQQRWKEERWK